LLMVPIYIMALNLGLDNTYAGMVLPHVTTAFGVFLMRQSFSVIPYAMDESARMDGANSFQIWFRILMLLVKPSILTLSIFTFLSPHAVINVNIVNVKIDGFISVIKILNQI